MFRFLATGDWHPNSKGLLGNKVAIDLETGLSQTLSDLRKSLNYILDVATDKDRPCDAILVAGDVFDSNTPDMDEVRVILDWVRAVTDAGITILAIPGNHDISRSGSSASALEPLKGRGRVIVMERPSETMLAGTTPPRAPNKIWYKGGGGRVCRVRVCGLPYPTRNLLLANEAMAGKPPEEVTRTVNFNLKRIIQNFVAGEADGLPSILLAHGATIDATVGVQPRSLLHDILIPMDQCTHFSYVALSHIHKAQTVAANAGYSGSLLRNDFGEGPEKKGFNLVEIEPGSKAKVEFIENPHAREWRTITLDHARDMMHHGSMPSKEIVWRIKDTAPPEVIEQTREAVARFQSTYPYVKVDIRPTTEDRARDEFMADMPSSDEAVQRWLDARDPEGDESTGEGIMAKHAEIEGEVTGC